MGRPRIADIAKAAGVSTGTVSNVFSKPDLVREEVRVQVEAVARQMGYGGPDPRARLFRAGKANAIGVATIRPLASMFSNPFARALMENIAAACDDAGIGVSLISANRPEQLAWNIKSAVVDGLVLLCMDGDERLVELARERGLPSVSIAFARSDQPISTIVIDEVGAAALATRHLATLGHRRFGILSLKPDGSEAGVIGQEDALHSPRAVIRDRIRGYLDGLAQAGVEPEVFRIFQIGRPTGDVELGLEGLFSGDRTPTAIVCMADTMALSALRWLKQRGFAVPDDVSVVGFDGIPEVALAVPALTTVAQPIEAMARQAVELILQPPDEPQANVVTAELVVRSSTARPTAEHSQ